MTYYPLKLFNYLKINLADCSEILKFSGLDSIQKQVQFNGQTSTHRVACTFVLSPCEPSSTKEEKRR